jgi:tetratricopeptide (TPR) repeat protein
MVFLKTKVVLLLFTCSVFMSQAQEKTLLQSSFIKSFTLESVANYSEAAEALLTEYNVESYETNLRLGWLYYKAADFKSSDKYYTIAMGLMPYAVEAKLGATLPRAELNDWDAVLQLYKEVLSIDKKNNVALYNAGLIYYNRSSFGEAYELFKELNNLYPTDYSALLMHGWSALKVGKTRESKVLFTSLLLLYPSDTSAQEARELLK